MPTSTTSVKATSGALTLVAYRGDRAVLLAMDLPENKIERLAGFSLWRTPPGGPREPIYNRLDFTTAITTATTPAERRMHPSNEAPFQKFRWVDVPSNIVAGDYLYTAQAMYFDTNGALVPGDSATVSIDIFGQPTANLEVGFTRGFMSSQAYADTFHNAPIRPTQASMDFDTTIYQAQYRWLGFHARELLFGFLADCLADPTIDLDVFAYDLNEPDVIRSLARFGSRLRLYLDDSSLHTGPAALEGPAADAVTAGGGAVKRGHFGRFSHSKVLIASRSGTPFRVLTGSTNFSVRGLYVQANNVLVFDAPNTASQYAEAFNHAWDAADSFSTAPISQAWFPLSDPGLPTARVAFSPHADPALSLTPVSVAIGAATSSVLFAVMELEGGGEVLADLKAAALRKGVFSYGVTEATAGVRLYQPGSDAGVLVDFAYLRAHVPPPFTAEISGGQGQVVHDKFVVVDFNGPAPKVFTGSSNLSSGGEHLNGDNLIELDGPEVATLYAVEAVRQVDHYQFRVAMKNATTVAPLRLADKDHWQDWVSPYYRPNDLKLLDRQLFAR